jgi:F-box protein 9
VDRMYHREEKLATIFATKQAPAHKPPADSVETDGVNKTQHTLTLKPAGPKAAAAVVTGTLADLISGFPETLSFEPEIEQETVPLRKFPDELLVMVLRKLDPTSIERFAMVNCKARIITLEPSIWKWAFSQLVMCCRYQWSLFAS